MDELTMEVVLAWREEVKGQIGTLRNQQVTIQEEIGTLRNQNATLQGKIGTLTEQVEVVKKEIEVLSYKVESLDTFADEAYEYMMASYTKLEKMSIITTEGESVRTLNSLFLRLYKKTYPTLFEDEIGKEVTYLHQMLTLEKYRSCQSKDDLPLPFVQTIIDEMREVSTKRNKQNHSVHEQYCAIVEGIFKKIADRLTQDNGERDIRAPLRNLKDFSVKKAKKVLKRKPKSKPNNLPPKKRVFSPPSSPPSQSRWGSPLRLTANK